MTKYDVEKRLFSVRELNAFMAKYRYSGGRTMRQSLRKLLAENQMDALIWLTGGIKEFNEQGRTALDQRLQELQAEIDAPEAWHKPIKENEL